MPPDASEPDPAPDPRDRAILALEPGDVIADRYKVRAQLGVGGMGAVYRVFDRLREVEVALKIMLPSLYDDPGAAIRFKREVDIALALAHDNVVRVYDMGEDAGRGFRFFTMELIDGISLRAWLDLKLKMRKIPSVQKSGEIAAHVLEALVKAHTITVHCDLKPENVMLTQAGGVKVLDFGVAKDRRVGARQTRSSGALGTALYMAPEQLVDRRDLDARVDVYATFAVLYELLTGEAPVGRFCRPSERRRGIPLALDELIMRCLAPRREDRPPSAKEALEELRACLGGIERTSQRRRFVAVVASLVGAIVAALVIGIRLGRSTSEEPPSAVAATPAKTSRSKGGGADRTPGAVAEGGAGPPVRPPGDARAAAGAGSAARVVERRPDPPGATASGPSPPTLVAAARGGDTPGRRPPALSILSPPDGLVTTATAVAVSGSVRGERPVFVTVAGLPVTPTAEGRFEVTLELPEGESAIDVRARGTTGPHSLETRRVVRDSRPPELTVATPPEGLVTTTTAVTVRGQAQDDRPGVSVMVGGEAAQLRPDGSFEVSRPLGEGQNRIEVRARDAAGNEAVTSRVLTSLPVPPQAVLLAPPEGFVTTATALVARGIVLTRQPGTTIMVGGQSVSPDGGGAFSYPLSLVEGDNVIAVRLRNAAGLEAEIVRRVACDTRAPAVVVTAPTEGLVTSGTAVVVQGTVRDERPGVALWVDGAEVQVRAGGGFERTVQLAEGDHVIEARARDAAGNECLVRRGLRCDRTPPEIALTWPGDGLVTTATAIVVLGVARDASGPPTVTLGGRSVPVGADGAFLVDVPLSHGGNTIVCRARDLAGLERTATVHLTRTAPPRPIPLPPAAASPQPKERPVAPTAPAAPTPAAPAPRPAAPPTEVVDPRDGAVLVLVPTGTALVGQPPRPVTVAAFYVEKTETTVEQYARFMASADFRPALRRALDSGGAARWLARAREQRANFVFAAGGEEVEVASVDDLARVLERGPYFWTSPGHLPPTWPQPAPTVASSTAAVGLSWYEAQAYATWAGRRLPMETEWLRARDVLGARWTMAPDDLGTWCTDEVRGAAADNPAGRLLRSAAGREVAEPIRREFTGIRTVRPVR